MLPVMTDQLAPDLPDRGPADLAFRPARTLRVAALFAGIGGIEHGLSSGSHFKTTFLCEMWAPAQAVLRTRFPDVDLVGDILDLDRLPSADLVTAGFPCTDLSLAGRMAGIDGSQSGLVRKALQLVDDHPATWLLLENVRNMLPLHGGRAMKAVTDELSGMGFRWAYRVVDSRFIGVPQRRQRVIVLASRTDDPRPVLFADDAGAPPDASYRDDAFGFYWTEGLRGLGWCPDGLPTLKGGSSIGIASPPAVWRPFAPVGSRVVTPGVETAERLQGFEAGWTRPGGDGPRGDGVRWKLIGNAVTVGVAEWVGRRLLSPGAWEPALARRLPAGSSWPLAAFGDRSGLWAVDVSKWPERKRYQHLSDLMGDDWRPLSHRATSGFLSRLQRSSLTVPSQFSIDLAEHAATMAWAAA